MEPYYDDGKGIQIYLGDCREVLAELPPQIAHVVVADPPFSVPVKYHDSNGDFPRSWGDLVVMEPFFREVFNALRRAVKDTGQVYVCCDANSYPVFYKVGMDFWPDSQMLVWYKATGRRGRGWMHAHELILHFRLASTIYSDLWRQDVIGIMPVRTLNRQHPAEKPIDLVAFLCEAYPHYPFVLLDPFLGSGNSLVLAKRLRIPGIGIEVSERYCEIAAKRLAQEVLPLGVV